MWPLAPSWHQPLHMRSSSPVVAWNFSRLLQSEQTLCPQNRQWCRRKKVVNFRLQRWHVALWIIGIPYFCNLAFELLTKSPVWLPRRVARRLSRTWNGKGKCSVNKQSDRQSDIKVVCVNKNEKFDMFSHVMSANIQVLFFYFPGFPVFVFLYLLSSTVLARRASEGSTNTAWTWILQLNNNKRLTGYKALAN